MSQADWNEAIADRSAGDPGAGRSLLAGSLCRRDPLICSATRVLDDTDTRPRHAVLTSASNT